MSTKQILVTGATGRQGSALISALRPQGDTTDDGSFHVLAMTRKATSPAAKKLSLEKHVTVVEGNLDNPDSVKEVFEEAKEKGGIWGVFCVLAFPGLGANADGEEKQGKTLADISMKYGVSSFVFSSVERGGESYDDKLVLDRLAKVRIERHVRELGTQGLPWTILRPGFFMENFEGTIGSITAAVLKSGLKPTTAVQLIAVDDIGHVAAGVFKNPEEFKSQILVVVGDVLTVPEQQAAYKTATGSPMPSIPAFLARFLISVNGHTQGLISDMERVYQMRIDPTNEENAAQVALTRKAYPDMTSFSTWAAQKHKRDPKREKNWNQVSIGRLVTGRQ
ncbi:NAD(P)-binding protein [Collybia nuda]|uniref:NAD(P)-binding protein n=1 Tax=Collybia nuda TaxID=64659 RepID=A0A9P6CBY4_9AGAR|nr:NAD(P)-binding protein [Collybia nuda]